MLPLLSYILAPASSSQTGAGAPFFLGEDLELSAPARVGVWWAVVGGNWLLFLDLILHPTIIILHQLFNKHCFEDTKENSKGRDSPSKTSQSMGDKQKWMITTQRGGVLVGIGPGMTGTVTRGN